MRNPPVSKIDKNDFPMIYAIFNLYIYTIPGGRGWHNTQLPTPPYQKQIPTHMHACSNFGLWWCFVFFLRSTIAFVLGPNLKIGINLISSDASAELGPSGCHIAAWHHEIGQKSTRMAKWRPAGPENGPRQLATCVFGMLIGMR